MRDSNIGRRFELLKIVEFRGNVGKYNRSLYRCKCDCGKVKDFFIGDLNSGRVKSCGCLKKGSNNSNYKHGFAMKGKTEKLHKVWSSIKQRCYNPKNKQYKYYGEKGVSMDAEWKDDYIAFRDWAMANGYKEGLHFDRVDSDRNYEPSNIRFVTVEQNTKNKKHKINPKTGYYGVYYNKKTNRYVVNFYVDKVNYTSKAYKEAMDAAKAYNLLVTANGFDRPLNKV